MHHGITIHIQTVAMHWIGKKENLTKIHLEILEKNPTETVNDFIN